MTMLSQYDYHTRESQIGVIASKNALFGLQLAIQVFEKHVPAEWLHKFKLGIEKQSDNELEQSYHSILWSIYVNLKTLETSYSMQVSNINGVQTTPGNDSNLETCSQNRGIQRQDSHEQNMNQMESEPLCSSHSTTNIPNSISLNIPPCPVTSANHIDSGLENHPSNYLEIGTLPEFSGKENRQNEMEIGLNKEYQANNLQFSAQSILGPNMNLQSKRLYIDYEGVVEHLDVDQQINIESLLDLVKKHFQIEGPFQLKYYDNNFEEYFMLTSIKKIEDKQKYYVQKLNPPQKKSQIPAASSQTNNKPEPWSANFEIPDFGAANEKMFEGRELTKGDRSMILRRIFEAVSAITLYPKPTDYKNLTTALLLKYPKLYEKSGYNITWTSWKASIAGNFQNLRQRSSLTNCPEVRARSLKMKRRSRCEETNLEPLTKKKALQGLSCFLPLRPSGLSDSTIDEHVVLLKKEKSKPNPDPQKAFISMEATFCDRRNEVVNRQTSVLNICNKYPWLVDEHEILLEYSRLLGDSSYSIRDALISELKFTFKPLMTTLKARYFKIQGKECKYIHDLYHNQTTETAKEDIEVGCSLLLLIYLLGEEPKDIFLKQESDVKSKDPTVAIRYKGSNMCTADYYSVEITSVTIGCSSLINTLSVFIASHFVFNLQYGKKYSKFLNYVERFILKIDSGMKLPMKVVNARRIILETS